MPATIQDPQELFLYQLGEMLFVERTLADQVLPQLSTEVENAQLREGIDAHRDQTREHARNIEKAFELLGQPAEPQPSPALQGLQQSHDQLAPKIERKELRDVFDAEAAAKTEHLEIAAYRSLITMAQQMGLRDLQDLLQTNCTQEEQTLQRLESMSERLNQQLAAA